MDMVEKTRRSLTVLRRCQEADREELNYWIRRYSDAEDLKKGGSGSSSHSRQQSPVNPDPVALGIFSSGGHIEHIYFMLLMLILFLTCLFKNKGYAGNFRTINTLHIFKYCLSVRKAGRLTYAEAVTKLKLLFQV